MASALATAIGGTDFGCGQREAVRERRELPGGWVLTKITRAAGELPRRLPSSMDCPAAPAVPGPGPTVVRRLGGGAAGGRAAGPAGPGPPGAVRRHLRAACRWVRHRRSRTVHRHVREAVDVLAALAPSPAEAMKTERRWASPGRHSAADRRAGLPAEGWGDRRGHPRFGKQKRYGNERPGPHGPVRAVGCAARRHARPGRGPCTRDHRCPHGGGTHVPGGQGVPGRRPLRPCPVPGPVVKRLKPTAQHHPREGLLRRRAGHGRLERRRPLRELRCRREPTDTS
ncbi:hypothetical protein SHIRM173S_10118 [Streptomyces hirsutus]